MAGEDKSTYIIDLRDLFSPKLASAGKNLDNFEKKVDKIKNTNFGPMAARFASLFSVAAIGTALKRFSDLGAKFEQTRISYQVMVGDITKGNALLAQLKDYANVTPYVFSDISESGKLLLNYGVNAEKVLPTLKMLGDVAGGDANKLHLLTLAYSQVSATGRLMGQDLLQLVNSGFNPLKVISEKTGISMGDLKKKMEEGAISARDVERAFKIATSQGGLFFDMTNKQSQTFAGKMSTIIDKLETGMTSLGEKLNQSLGPILDKILSVLDKGNVAAEAQNYNGVRKKQTELSTLYDSYKSAKGTAFQKEYEQMILDSFPELGTDFTSGKAKGLSESKLNRKLESLQNGRDAAYLPSYEFNKRVAVKYARIDALQNEINSGKEGQSSPFTSLFGLDKLDDNQIKNRIAEIEKISNEIKGMQKDYESFNKKTSRKEALDMLLEPFDVGGGFSFADGKGKKKKGRKDGVEGEVRSGGVKNIVININAPMVGEVSFNSLNSMSENQVIEILKRGLLTAVNDANVAIE